MEVLKRMGQINFEAWKNKQAAQTKTTNNNNYQQKDDKPYVGYFTLKNDKDYAIVRIMHDSPADFDMVTGHRFTVNDKLRMVNCLREDLNDPVEKCPLCAAGKKTEDKIYIHLIEYSMDPQGQIIATPKIWERSASYANTLINYINEYGPLSDVIFKLTRNGEAGSKKTTYDLMYTNPNVYRPELYPKKSELFEGYKAVGNAVWTLKADKLNEMLSGAPASTTPSQAPVEVTPRVMPTTQQSMTQANPVPTYEVPAAPSQQQAAPATPIYPTNTSTTGEAPSVARPQRRYYN